jgi:hypothetical protein
LSGTPSTLTVVDSTVADNGADGGAAGSGGSAGLGQGGGVYVVPGGSVCVDVVTHLTHNHASSSDDDIFGVFTTCP